MKHTLRCGLILLLVLALPRMAGADNRPDVPVPVIELRGEAAEIGAGHAKELEETILLLLERYIEPQFRNEMERAAALTLARGFEPRLSPSHRAEVRALAEGLQIDHRLALLAQCFLDLSVMAGCSTITLPASAAEDGIARFGRNLDFPSFGVADKHSVVIIVHPQDRYSFAAVTWPGMIGVLSGMNEHGLTLSNMEVARPRRLPAAMPYTLLYRTVLEQCRTVDEAIELLRSTPRQTANNLMLMDAAGDRAVVEITRESVTVRRADDGAALISTNHHRGTDMATAGHCRRYDHLHATAGADYGRIDRPAIESMLRAVSQGDSTMQSMIFEPSRRVIHLATGARAAHQPFHTIDLNAYFE